MPISNNGEIIFVHIPKCAGHSIEKAIGIRHKEYSINDFSFQCLFGKELQHLSLIEIENLSKTSIVDSPQVFSVVRNPAERLQSEYFWSGPWRDIDDFYENHVAPGLDRYTYDLAYRHLAPQYYFLLPGKRIKVNEIYLMSEIDEINKRFNFEKIPHINRTSKSIKKKSPSLLNFLEISKKHYAIDHEMYDLFVNTPIEKRVDIVNNLKLPPPIDSCSKKIENTYKVCDMSGHIFNNMNFVTQGLWMECYSDYVQIFIELESRKGLVDMQKKINIEDFFLNISRDSRKNLIMENALRKDIGLWLDLCRILSKGPNLAHSLLMKKSTFITNKMTSILRRLE
jgi:hypothetical protein